MSHHLSVFIQYKKYLVFKTWLKITNLQLMENTTILRVVQIMSLFDQLKITNSPLNVT